MTLNHYLISLSLTFILYLIFIKNKNETVLRKPLFILIGTNLISFNSYLILTNRFDLTIHLPLHLCYLTELGIFISLIFKSQLFYPWFLLNSLGGGITGFLNSNLDQEAMFIEHIHLHMSHFNLLLFSLFLYKSKYYIKKIEFKISIIFNSLIFIIVFFLNGNFGSNYWFTKNKPPGINLTSALPDWPYYLIILTFIGLISYYVTYIIFSKKS